MADLARFHSGIDTLPDRRVSGDFRVNLKA
jgi:hypothetical protein